MIKKEKTTGFEARKKAFENTEGVIHLDNETLHRLQRVILNMLKDVLKVFNEYDIFYTLSGGSVLGAIRHKGFIPWDDDIDLNMPRKDFEKFKKVFNKELGNKYELCTPEYGKEHGMTVSQIKKRGTIYRSYNELSKSDCGICIDIFILENVPDNRIIRILHGYRCLAMGYLMSARKTYNDLPYLKKYCESNPELKELFARKARIGRLIKWISLDSLSKSAMRCYSSCKNNKSKYVSIPSGRKHYFGEMYKREDMCEAIQIPFEDIIANIPKGTKNYMITLYGDTYMTIPPKEKREVHPLIELDFGNEDL